MKIRIRYENQFTTMDVPEEDFETMIQQDYEERLARAADPAAVRRRSPQEILEDLNRADYNCWQKHWRRMDDHPRPPRLDHKAGYLARQDDGNSFHPDDGDGTRQYTVEDFPDLAGMEKQISEEQDQELREWIREQLKPDYAEMLIAIHMEGMKGNDYAALTGVQKSAVSHRLRRAEKKFQEIYKKRQL